MDKFVLEIRNPYKFIEVSCTFSLGRCQTERTLTNMFATEHGNSCSLQSQRPRTLESKSGEISKFTDTCGSPVTSTRYLGYRVGQKCWTFVERNFLTISAQLDGWHTMLNASPFRFTRHIFEHFVRCNAGKPTNGGTFCSMALPVSSAKHQHQSTTRPSSLSIRLETSLWQ